MSRVLRGTLEVDGRPFSWLREGTVRGHPLVLLAHGAGAPMHSVFLDGVAQGLLERGMAVVRFHFPYMERMVQEGRRRPPDARRILLATWRTMLQHSRRWQGATRRILAGKSMGARMASMLLAEEAPPDVHGAVYFGYPLHPSGRPETLRSAHLTDVRVPQLFVTGTQDALCDLARLRPVLRRLGPAARLHLVQGGDHSLAIRRNQPLLGADRWLDEVRAFVSLREPAQEGPGFEHPES